MRFFLIHPAIMPKLILLTGWSVFLGRFKNLTKIHDLDCPIG